MRDEKVVEDHGTDQSRAGAGHGWPRLDPRDPRWRGFGSVVLLFLVSRFAFYLAAFAGSGLVPESTGNPVRVGVNSRLPVALRHGPLGSC